MDVKEAIQTARICIADVFANEGITQLNLEEAVQDRDTQEWRITFRFTRTWGKRNTRYARKVFTIDDADKRIISITDCHRCDQECAHQSLAQDACNAEQSEQPSRIAFKPVRWWDTPLTLLRAFIVYSAAGVGWAALIWLFVGAIGGSSTSQSNPVLLLAIPMSVIVGMFVEGWRWQKSRIQRSDNERRNRSGG